MTSSSKRQKENDDAHILQEFRKSLEHVARVCKVEPVEVSRDQYVQYGLLSKNQLSRFGGFANAKILALTFDEGLDVHPFASRDVNKLEGKELCDHIARVIEGCAKHKNKPPHEITWDEFRYHIKLRWGENDAGIARYVITRAGGFNRIRDAYFQIKPTPEVVNKIRLGEHADINRRVGKELGKLQFIIDRIEELSKTCFRGAIKPILYKDKATLDSDERRILNVVWSDHHIGSDIDEEETGVCAFGRIEESRRIASIVKQVVKYKVQYRSSTKLRVLLLGDLIQNLLHSQQDGAITADQFMRATHIYNQAIAHFASAFPEVEIVCITGNHDRLPSKHQGRAIHQKYDSIGMMIFSAVRDACVNLKNVKFIIPKSPYYGCDTFGDTIYVTHGDTTFNIGNANQSLAIAKIEHKVNKINAARREGEKYSAFIIGHIHLGINGVNLSNGEVVITNGPLCPPDPYAVSLDIMEAACGQMIFESTPGFPVGDTRFVRVGRDDDMDESLDEIIKPWKGFVGGLLA